jgi:uncharacterized protein YjbI with pentapeptide repeats
MLQPKNNSLTLIVKGCFDLIENETASFTEMDDAATIMGSIFNNDDPDASLNYASDFVIYKPKADLTLTGVAYPECGKAGCQVTFAVGNWRKSLAIFNDRFWRWGTASRPEPFLGETANAVPLVYENSYGGEKYGFNPVGKGANKIDSSVGDNIQPLPNIEHIDSFISSPSQQTLPAGFAPLKDGWGDKTPLLGTYDDKWLKTEFPGMPADFNWGYFNSAPQDQQVDYLCGDEKLYFENLNPDKPEINGQLPAIRPRLFVKGELDRQDIYHEVTLRLDTLHVDMEKQQLHLVWRGVVGVASDEYEELSHACLFCEDMNEQAHLASHYRTSFDDWLVAEDTEFDLDEFEDEEGLDLPISEASGNYPDVDTEETVADSGKLVATEPQLDDLLIDVFDQLKGQLKKLGASENIIALVQPGMDMGVFNREVFKAYNIKPVDSKTIVAKNRQSMSNFMSEQGFDLAELEDIDNKTPTFDAKEDNESTEPRSKLQKLIISKESCEGLDLVEVDLSHQDLSNMNFRGADLTKANLTGANLSGADFTDADLSNATMQKVKAHTVILDNAILDQADASFSDFSHASLLFTQCQRTNLIKANFTQANLCGADFSQSVIPGANFDGTAMRETLFEQADLSQSRFKQVMAQGCDFTDANLRESSFTKSDLRGAVIDSARLTLTSFEHSDLSEAILENVDARGIKLTNCKLDSTRAGEQSNFSKAQITGGSAIGVIFESSNLEEAVFSEISLQAADFSATNLIFAEFHHCDMQIANFGKANVTDAKLSGINLFQASFTKSKLVRTDLSESNLFGAEFRQASIDNINLHNANIGRTEIELRMIEPHG